MVYIFDYKFLIFPINLSKSDWILVVLNLKTTTFQYYDSYTYDVNREPNYHIFGEAIGKLINHVAKMFLNKDKLQVKIMESIQKQKNNCDCGLYMLYQFLCQIMQYKISFVQNEIQKQFHNSRKRLHLIALTHGKDEKKILHF